MNPDNNNKETMMSLVKQNHDLLVANNELLTKINRREVRQFWFKVFWYSILLGVPMIAYYYLYNTFLGSVSPSMINAQTGVNLDALQEVLKLYSGQ